jgi:hypothetical protein
MSNIKDLKAKEKKILAELAKVQQNIKQVALVATGDVPAPAIAKLIKSQSFSYSVVFVRRKALNKPKNKKKGLSFASDRRFATLKEAQQHGRRFVKKHKHESFHAIKVSKKANSWINWATGKTNPVKS